jgi:xanthine/CO dehydrogenase XdhC/CoxF family maturation factor
MARVVGVPGSGPRDAGATMVVNDEGEVAGSVSGCVEGAVVAPGPGCARSTTPTRMHLPSADLRGHHPGVCRTAGLVSERRTKADCEQRLREAGVSDEDLSRTMAPIGQGIGDPVGAGRTMRGLFPHRHQFCP